MNVFLKSYKNNRIIIFSSKKSINYVHKNDGVMHIMICVPRFFAHYQTRMLQTLAITQQPANQCQNWFRLLANHDDVDTLRSFYSNLAMMAPQYLKVASDLDLSTWRKASLWDENWQQLRRKCFGRLKTGVCLVLFYCIWLKILHYFGITHSASTYATVCAMVFFIALSLSFLSDWIADCVLGRQALNRSHIAVNWLLKHYHDFKRLHLLGGCADHCTQFLHNGGTVNEWFIYMSRQMGCRPTKVLQHMRMRWFTIYTTIMSTMNLLLSLSVVVCMIHQLFQLQSTAWSLMGGSYA